MPVINKHISLYFLLYFLSIIQLKSQDVDTRFNSYQGYSIDYRFNKKSKVRVGQLFCINHNPSRLQFIQYKLGWIKRINDPWSIDFHYKPMFFRGNSRNIWFHRLSINTTKRDKLFKLPMQNSITAEVFLPRLNKYRYRFIYTFKYSFKNKVLPLRATPYIKYQLYYYLGGKALDYYNDTGEILLASQAPNDFHRYRLSGGIRMRAAKYFYITLYYIWQEEFNTLLTSNRSLNILNQNQTRILYPYNDYQVVGLSLSYSIKKKKK